MQKNQGRKIGININKLKYRLRRDNKIKFLRCYRSICQIMAMAMGMVS
jgi:hypothetical protein